MEKLTLRDIAILGATQLVMFVVFALTQVTTHVAPLPMAAAAEGAGGGFREFINSVIYLVGGGLAVSIGAGLAIYVLGQFNKTGVTISSQYNMFQSFTPLLSTLFVIATVVILVALVVLVIRKVMEIPREV